MVQYTEDSVLVKDQMSKNRQLFFQDGTKDLSNIASCECGHISGNYMEGAICPQCHTQVKTNFAEDLKFRRWLEIPDFLPPLLHPAAYRILENWLGPKSGILTGLLDTNQKLPAEFQGVFGQGFEYFYNNFDNIISYLAQCKKFNTPANKPKTEATLAALAKYRENITVTDDIDPNPILEVDTSEVIMDEEGTYTVTYRAYDFTGNVSEETIELTLIEKPDTYVEPELVYEEAQDILDSITWDSMTDMERALAITYWVRYNVYYVSNCDDSSWTRAAYDGLTKRSGNCYTFAMTAKALFDVAGIENMVIIRDPYIYNPHYWNYIKIDGEWYHCDSTPRMGYDSYFFMYTTEELENFWHNGWNGYSFDEDLYPESAEESVQWRINYGSHSISD